MANETAIINVYPLRLHKYFSKKKKANLFVVSLAEMIPFNIKGCRSIKLEEEERSKNYFAPSNVRS